MNGIWADLDFNFVVVEPDEGLSARTLGFLDHCRALQGDRPFPRWSDFRLHDLANEVIPYTAVVDVAHQPTAFTYRFWGTGHTEIKGVDMTGKRVSEITASELARIGVRQYQMILAQGRPLVFLHTLKHYGAWKDHIQVSGRVPFSEDGRTIDKIVSYSNYDEDRLAWSEIYHSLLTPERAQVAQR